MDSIPEHTAELADANASPELERQVWTLTPAGAYLAAAYASDDYLADDTTERAERMLRLFELAERLAETDA